jgi:hypothetical protein
MILLNALVTDIIFEAVRFAALAVVMVLAILAGKKLRDRTDAKKAAEEKEIEKA